MATLRCTRKGCNYSTDSPSALISHEIDHRIAKVSAEQTSKPKFPHTTAKEMLDCPDCRRKIEGEFVKRGYERPEDVCPECGTKMKKRLLGGYYCPECPTDWSLEL